MSKLAVVYGTFDNQGDAAYLYNGDWYITGHHDELSDADIKYYVFKSPDKWSEHYISALGLNNPEFLVRFEVEV